MSTKAIGFAVIIGLLALLGAGLLAWSWCLREEESRNIEVSDGSKPAPVEERADSSDGIGNGIVQTIEPPGTPAETRLATVLDYVNVVNDVMEKLQEIPSQHKASLRETLVKVVEQQFPNNGADNESMSKCERFRRDFGRLVTLQGTGAPVQPDVMADEKLNYLEADLELRLVTFFSILPLPPEGEKMMRTLIAPIRETYKEAIAELFPEFETFAGAGCVAAIVEKETLSIEEGIDDSFKAERWLLLQEEFTRQAAPARYIMTHPCPPCAASARRASGVCGKP